MEINNLKNKILGFLIKSCFIFLVFFNITQTTFAIETYAPLETITIGEFIYNDDYSATADDCSITIYSPSLVSLVNTTMTDEGGVGVTGWHYYTYTIPATEGKYPTYITCGSIPTGDLFKLDKSFIAKTSPASTADVNSAVTAINANTDSKTSTLATTAQLTSATSPLATAANLALVKAKTDTILWSDITSLPANIWAYSGRTLTAFGALAADVWNNTYAPTRTLTSFGTLVADVWGNATRTITGGTSTSSNMLTASDVWTYGTRNLTDGTLTSGSLAKISDLSGLATATNVTDATSGLATASGLTAATSPLATASGLTAATSGLATASGLTAATSGLATASGLTSAVTPLATSAGLTAAVTPLATSANVTSSTNTITSEISAIPLNVWNYTTRTLTSFGTLVADVWSYVTRTLTEASPPQVIINSISDTTVPSISANVTITNEGLTSYEYQYEWCVILNVNDNCGDVSNIFHSMAAKLINSMEDFNTTLTATVPNPGDYHFKLLVHYGTESSVASRSFTAIAGGAGGGGGSATITPIDTGICGRADFNCDKKVNSIDFSILLYYWKSNPPFRNIYVDITKDNKVDSVDFSILLYEWGKTY